MMVFYLSYCIEIVFAANCDILQFTVRALGETIGERNLQMRDIKLQERPWTCRR